MTVTAFVQESLIAAAGRRAQDVELYDGTFDATREFVHWYARPVGLLQWRDDLDQRFSKPKDDPGDVKGKKWGTGALLAGNLFLTTGHCFDPVGGPRRRPMRNGRTLSAQELALLMEVCFDFHRGPNGVRPGVVFPVIRLIEHRVHDVDYAVAELGEDAAGKLPNELFGYLRVAQDDVTEARAKLAIFQHPIGKPKKIDTGTMVRNAEGVIAYVDVDTNGGSSGAPILYPCNDNSRAGEIVGIHQRGGFGKYSGSSMGVAVGAIRAVSSVL